MAEKYAGWVFKNKWCSLLPYFFGHRRRDVIEKLGILRWEAWEKEGHIPKRLTVSNRSATWHLKDIIDLL